MSPRAAAVHRFWFGEFDAEGRVAADLAARWFEADDRLDRRIRARFEPDLRNAAAGRLRRWEREARQALALVLLFDQFPRNMYQGASRAFLFDGHARTVMQRAIRHGHEDGLLPIERAFLYMPLQHSEELSHQDESVERFRRLAGQVPMAQVDLFRGFLGHAEQHRRMIARFGRFPHRNRILGRESTQAEQEFLAAGGQTRGLAGAR